MGDEPNKNKVGRKKLWRRFLSDNRGAAALEFAFVVPFLLLIYLLAMEFSLAIEVNKKVSRVASQIADLVTQQPSISTGDLQSIMRIGESSLQPFRGDPTMTVTAIEVTKDSTPQARVVWSRMWDGNLMQQAVTPGSRAEIPDALMVPGAFLIRSETNLQYKPVIAPEGGSGILGISDNMFPIDMSELYYMQPRMTHWIECKDC
ncbi:TadE/TadG family type IV pilus assembly protein [Chelativorans sp. YIM 93263]|uniref:TadE/TadG family type IV pilus assembly protein n=1 Tax=Chelativorans sp. YIM 93263 TaxID=2906648 RepID=UPI002378A7DB|nr:TadE/TadG family type IV pilus assembly protein [Chelativorans sp. YIM 93263]